MVGLLSVAILWILSTINKLLIARLSLLILDTSERIFSTEEVLSS